MHPIIRAELIKLRMADLHREAERNRITQAARRAHRESGLRTAPGRRASGLARRALAVFSPSSLGPAR